MRFTASAPWTQIASQSNRVITWTVSIKNTTSLSEALSAGTWTDVTSFLPELPAISQRIEYELGQFSSDSISFTGRNIDWWEANIFTAAYFASTDQYLELKITATQSSGSTVTADTFYAFSGFIDKSGIDFNEMEDSVSFTVYTADELGNRISALNINTQYINTDIDGSGTNGLILPAMSGVYITDASITNFNLKVGLHQIEYIDATDQIRLDDGAYTTLSGSDQTVTLANLAVDEKVTVRIDAGALNPSNVPIIDYIIVSTAGSSGITGTFQPYYKLSLKTMFVKAYSQVGVSSVSFDTLELNTFNGSGKISFYENIPEDSSIIGKRSTIIGDGTDLYMTAANKLYKRTTSTGLYTLLATFSADANAFGKKLMYNARNTNFWLFYQSTAGDCIKKISLDGLTVSAEVVLHATADTVNRYSVELVDVNYTGISWLTGILWMRPEDPAVIRFIESGAMTSSAVYSYGAGVSCIKNRADFIFTKTTNDFQVLLYFTAVLGTKLAQFQIDATGTWVLVGTLTGRTTWEEFSIAAYHAGEDKLYYYAYTSGGITTDIKSLPRDAGGTATTILSGIYYRSRKSTMIYADTKVWTSTRGYLLAGQDIDGTLYSMTTSAATVLSSSIYSEYGSLVYQGRLYGIDGSGTLYQYHTVLNMHASQDPVEGESVRGYITRLLQAFNLVGIISSNKTAFVYRRGDDTGAFQTTGNAVSLTTSNTSNIRRVAQDYQKIKRVTVTSGDTTYSYDGTTYNAGILSDAKTLELSNDLIPEAIVQDMAKYLYTFYAITLDKYIFNVDVSQMQYEVMDGASVTFSTTKIAKTATGLITAQTINNDGSMELEVIF